MFPTLLAGLAALAATASALFQPVRAADSTPPHVEFKCHLRMQAIDPELDARIRIPIPEEKRTGSKMRFISPSCGNSAQVVHGFTETVRVRAARKK